MRVLRALTILLTATVIVVAGSAHAQAQVEGEARLGGGSDIPLEVTIRLPQGGSIPPIHGIFADNPADEPIQVEFRADTPTGILIGPEWDERTIPAQGRVENHFTVEVGPGVAPGEYPVVVQLVRSDIESVPGEITNIPAVQAAFTVEVTGEAATVAVSSVSAITGEPVSGTLTLSAVLPDGNVFEIDRVDGSTLETDVAPGQFRAAFLLGGREVAAEEFTIEPDQHLDVVLEVETVSFVLAAVRPVEERGRVVVVDLVASVNNEAGPIPGPGRLQARVFRDGSEIDTIILSEASELPPGITEATTTYRPADGWQPGSYRFVFELATPAFTLTAPEQPVLEVPNLSGFDLLAFLAALDTREIIALSVGSLLGLLLLERLIRWIITRRRRHRHGHPKTVTPRRERRGRRTETRKARKAARKRNRSKPPKTSESWLEKRLGPVSTPRIRWNNSQYTPPQPAPTLDQPTAPTPETNPPVGQTHPPRPPEPTREGKEAVIEAATDAAVEAAIAPLDHPQPPSPPRHGGAQPASGGDPATITGSLRLIQKLHDQGMLSAEWSIADATLVHWALTSPELRQMLTSIGVSHEEYAQVMARLLRQGLLGSSDLQE